jgi:hypothetical protein
VGGLAFRLTSSMSLLGRGRLHYLHYNIDQDRSLGYWELAAMVTYDF